MKAFLFRFLIPLIIMAGGAAGALHLKNRAQKAKHQEPQKLVTSVETMTASPIDMPVEVVVTGSVMAANQVTLTPEVTGRVIKLSPNLIPGSRFKKGQVIAKIDRKDYLFALTQEKSRVHKAALDLEVEQGRGAVAKEEWNLIMGDLGEGESVSQLALRKPHLDVAEQQAISAKSGLEKAELNLKRTVLRAPFNAMVIDKKVDVGQLVGPTTPVATLMGTDELWVNVSVPVAQLSSIDIPGVNAKKGSTATITQRVGPGHMIIRKGEVIRLQGQLDAKNRTANLLVSIKNPFDLEEAELPLLAGAYVEVDIVGRDMKGVFEIPREALREDAFVWLVGPGDKLKHMDVTVGWGDRDNVVVTHGLKPGDKLITSPLSFPIEGMTVREVNGTGSGKKVAESKPIPRQSEEQ
jgi:RND family efflux transporter MFP subunit